MLWILLSIGTAFFSATEAALTRHGFEHASPSSAAVAPLLASLPLFALTLPFLDAPVLEPGFWPVLAMLVPVNALGFYLQSWSFKSSPLSLTVPFMAFTPAFVLVTGFVALGETPSMLGCLGVLVTVAGGYLLYAEKDAGIWAPFKAVLRERGSMLMLAAALVWSVASVMGKQLILLSSPLYAGCVFSLTHNLALLVFLALIGQVRLRELRPRVGHALGLGLCLYLHIICHFAAVAMTTVAYMLSIKRLNGLFALGFERLVFKQPLPLHRLHGTAWMTAGAVIIALA
jgi:drug/metabolite transporter (DMT)-like permease